ncbi:hypothetical protein BOTCAL_0140g00050 [Botryotinia calthae]|uniref:Uncharacterized protein n=1 Tax=Botryotinia calthae TaxID=38488 RepID=A0A4Y8D5F9_9HELO|nr:hypothetical protein BOTCAL_0140g00050 [Botryotinia calthae]
MSFHWDFSAEHKILEEYAKQLEHFLPVLKVKRISQYAEHPSLSDTIVSIRKNMTGRNCRCACGEAKEKEALKTHIANVDNKDIKNVFRDQNLLGKKMKENE